MRNPALGGAPASRSGRFDVAEFTRKTNDPQLLFGPRYERQIERLHSLGPRPLAELLAEIAAATGEPSLVVDHVEAYARLDPDLVRAFGGDHFSPMLLGVVR